LDEIEKAHPEVFNILLQVFEEGHLTDSLGNKISFKNAIIIMTSNIGAKHLDKRGGLGFAADDAIVETKSEEIIRSEIKKVFRPEFLNRIDEVIVFKSLNTEDLREIIKLLVEEVNGNLYRRGISITIDPEVADWIIEKTCNDRSYGARPLRRAIQKYIEDPISEILIRGDLPDKAIIVVAVELGELSFNPVNPPEGELSELVATENTSAGS
jgi:ATP-dependent Clp protease ATP-binding subunit ClpC